MGCAGGKKFILAHIKSYSLGTEIPAQLFGEAA
jgi:hypothetical protein